MSILSLFDIELEPGDLLPPPSCDGTDFVLSALRTTEHVDPHIRKIVQGDIATTLNCSDDDLAFLWDASVAGAQVLECEIPDVRTAYIDSVSGLMAAE